MSPTRRDLLKGALGLAAVGCGGRPTGRRRVAGSIVGGNHRRGHRLREAFQIPTIARREEVPVVIAGAGIAGLSAAWTLERAGLRDFLVLELEDAPGGTARYGEGPVTPYPWAAHYVPVPTTENRPLVALLEEVGAVEGRDARGRPVYAEEVLCREPDERLFFRGEWFEGLYPRVGASREDLAQLQAFEAEMRRWAGWRDARGRRAFSLPRARSADTPDLRALDALSMAEYLAQHGFTSERLRWFAEYGCRDDFGTDLAHTSAWAGVHYYAARLEDPAAESAPLLTWPEGNGRLVRHLAGLVGPRLRTGALVLQIDPRPDHVEFVYEDATGAGVLVRAEHAVFALPRFLARPIVSPWRAAPPAGLAATSYGAWMVANLTLSDRPASRGFPLAWDNVLYDSPSLGYVVATHQSGRDDGPTVFTYYEALTDADPRRARERLLALSWEDCVRRVLADLSRAHPGLEPLVERVDVYLWGHAMVRPLPGFLWSDALAEQSRPLGRLRFAHTDLSGMALFEEAQFWGVRAAESILRERKAAFRSWLE